MNSTNVNFEVKKTITTIVLVEGNIANDLFCHIFLCFNTIGEKSTWLNIYWINNSKNKLPKVLLGSKLASLSFHLSQLDLTRLYGMFK
jgi:hypothetical protein